MDSKAAYKLVNSRYGTLTVFANDTGATARSLVSYGEWAENEITFLQGFMTCGSTVLDVGAYIGTHTLAFARRVGVKGRVIAIEAQPDTFEVLKKNVETNLPVESQASIELENAIASSKNGQITIPTIDIETEYSFGSTSLVRVLDTTSGTFGADDDITHHRASVRTITIDSLRLQSCDLIKIDVEGVEDMVLDGAARTLERCAPVVYCECNSVTAGLNTMASLKRVRYKVFAHVVDAFNADNFNNAKENIFGNAREVALLGVPVGRQAQVMCRSARACELILDVENADDLVLALWNKPQYPGEVLRQGAAAKTGGSRVLNQYDDSKLELDQLRHENAVLQNIRTEQQCAIERTQAAHEQALALIKDQETAAGQLNALVEQRNADIAHLQASLDERNREIAKLQILLNQRHIDVSYLRGVVSQAGMEAEAKDEELAQAKALLCDLYASKSWRITRLLRWAGNRIQRLRYSKRLAHTQKVNS